MEAPGLSRCVATFHIAASSPDAATISSPLGLYSTNSVAGYPPDDSRSLHRSMQRIQGFRQDWLTGGSRGLCGLQGQEMASSGSASTLAMEAADNSLTVARRAWSVALSANSPMTDRRGGQHSNYRPASDCCAGDVGGPRRFGSPPGSPAPPRLERVGIPSTTTRIAGGARRKGGSRDCHPTPSTRRGWRRGGDGG